MEKAVLVTQFKNSTDTEPNWTLLKEIGKKRLATWKNNRLIIRGGEALSQFSQEGWVDN